MRTCSTDWSSAAASGNVALRSSAPSSLSARSTVANEASTDRHQLHPIANRNGGYRSVPKQGARDAAGPRDAPLLAERLQSPYSTCSIVMAQRCLLGGAIIQQRWQHAGTGGLSFERGAETDGCLASELPVGTVRWRGHGMQRTTRIRPFEQRMRQLSVMVPTASAAGDTRRLLVQAP